MPKNSKNTFKSKTPRQPYRGATQGDGPSYRGQPRVRLTLPGVLGTLSTTVTTGVIAQNDVVSTSQILNFASRFGNTFDEYRIVGATVRVRAVGPNSGILRCWFDEKSGSAPTQADAVERIGQSTVLNSADPKSCFQMKWTARDLLDLQYTAIGTSSSPVYFKIYTDNADFGAPIAATVVVFREIDLHVEFRGLKTS
jgi:hypothetical protein